MRTTLIMLLLLLMAFPSAAQDATEEPTDDAFVFGMFLIGPKDDGGWSQAHYEGGLFLEEEFDARMILQESGLDEANPSVETVVQNMVNNGAQVIFMTSASFTPFTNTIAPNYPDTVFIQIADDAVLTNAAPDNVGNLMGQMEHAKFMMGCAAALTTRTGAIGYLGPLIDTETRRLASSAYLGAQHCWDQYRGGARPLRFRVEWVGYWYHIPDVTNNPRRQVFSMYNDGIDVVLAGIDTPTPIEVAQEFTDDGRQVYATAYDSVVPCQQFAEVCIGSAFYTWGIPYSEIVQAVIDGEWQSEWNWFTPNWKHFGEVGETPVGYVVGSAFPTGRIGQLENFLVNLETFSTNQFVPPSFPLWQGPLSFNNGSLLAEEGELVNILDVWYLPQLLQGMEGENYQEELGLEFIP